MVPYFGMSTFPYIPVLGSKDHYLAGLDQQDLSLIFSLNDLGHILCFH